MVQLHNGRVIAAVRLGADVRPPGKHDEDNAENAGASQILAPPGVVPPED
jgi:hypothetical protein